MIPTALARAVPTAALLVTMAACTEDPSRSATPSPAPSGPSASAPLRTPTATASTPPSDENRVMNIRLTIDGHPVAATLDDSPTARDFAALLPLTLNLSDFHRTERIADLPRRLTTSGAPETAEAKAGDLAYYAPWGNLAVYYRDGGDGDAGLIILGHVTDPDTELLAGARKVTIEAAP